MLLLGNSPAAEAAVPAEASRSAAVHASASPDIVVIGAGAWGSLTALNLRKMGAKVTIVDAYGPGNARSTSGDETRGVRSSYGDKPGAARRALDAVGARSDEEVGSRSTTSGAREFRLNLFHVTGDLIMRTEWDNFQLRTQGLVGQEQDPVSGPQSRRRAQGVPGDLDGRHHGRALRAGCRRRSRAPRVPDASPPSSRSSAARSSSAARRHQRSSNGTARGDHARHRRNAARRHVRLRRRSVARKDVPGAVREEDARADRIRLLFRERRSAISGSRIRICRATISPA